MDKKLKMKWVKALESGEFKQARGVLSDHGRYCCLGVLRHIAHPGSTRKSINDQLCDDHLKEFGLTHREQDILADLNDGRDSDGCKAKRHNFKEIAAWIRSHL